MWPVAIYWCFIEVGTPPQKFPVAIDSGSPFLAIAGKGCDGCVSSAPNGAYSAQESVTSQPAEPGPSTSDRPGFWETVADGRPGSTAHFHYSYRTCDLHHPTAPCSISGSLYQDQVSIAGLGPVTTTFGQITNQTDNFDQFKVIDGLMGILPPMKGYSSRNLFARLVEEGVCDNIWALCLHQGSVSTGSLTLGGVDTRLVDGPITYVQNTGFDGTIWYYGVHVHSVTFGDRAFQVNHTAVLDSGTNILLLPNKLHDAVRDWMCTDSSLAFCKELWNDSCQMMSLEQIEAYPKVRIALDGVVLEMAPRDYLLLGSPLAKVAGQYCIGIRDGGDGMSGFIIGDTTLRHYYVVHDIGNRRIGWGKVNKDTCGSVGGPDAAETGPSSLSGNLLARPASDSQGVSHMAHASLAWLAWLMALACVACVCGLTLAGYWWAGRSRANAGDLGSNYISIE